MASSIFDIQSVTLTEAAANRPWNWPFLMTSSDQHYGCCEVTALTDCPRRTSCSFGTSLVCYWAVISRSEFADLSLTHPLSGFSKTHQWDGSASPRRHGHRAGDDKLHDSGEAWLDDTWHVRLYLKVINHVCVHVQRRRGRTESRRSWPTRRWRSERTGCTAARSWSERPEDTGGDTTWAKMKSNADFKVLVKTSSNWRTAKMRCVQAESSCGVKGHNAVWQIH